MRRPRDPRYRDLVEVVWWGAVILAGATILTLIRGG